MGTSRRFMLIAAVLAAVLTLAACTKSTSSGGGTTQAGQDGGKPAAQGGGSADEYVSTLCTALGEWLTTVQTKGQEMPTSFSNAKEGKRQIVAFLDDMIAATDQTISTLEQQGAPDVPGGEQAHAALVSAFQEVSTLFTDARDQIKGLSTKDEAAFGAQVGAIGTTMQNASGSVDTALAGLQSEDLDEAFVQNEACQQLQGTVADAA